MRQKENPPPVWPQGVQDRMVENQQRREESRKKRQQLGAPSGVQWEGAGLGAMGFYMGVSIKGVSKNGWFIKGNLIRIDDLGVPLLQKTPCGGFHSRYFGIFWGEAHHFHRGTIFKGDLKKGPVSTIIATP